MLHNDTTRLGGVEHFLELDDMGVHKPTKNPNFPKDKLDILCRAMEMENLNCYLLSTSIKIL